MLFLVSEEASLEVETPKKVCEPGSTFKIKCNTCGCSKDGTSAICTKMACPEIQGK